jgi:NitT/TauT family transport system substrate-binding protein
VKPTLILRISQILLTIGAIALGSGSASAEGTPIRLAHATWVGFGPLYIAKEKGFFKKHGVDVDLVVMEETPLRFAALRGGKVDVVSTTPDAGLLYMKSPDDFKYAGMLDQSFGADGVVAPKDIKSVADLKGHTVGVMKGSVSEYWLNLLLLPTGVKEGDLKTVDMTAADAGAAFVAKKIDAAVTWEPWLSRAKATDFGHVIVDSTSTPGALGDTLVTSSSFAASHPNELKGLLAAWDEAVQFARTNPDEANVIMAKGVGGWLKDPKEFAEVTKTIRFFDGKENKAFVGTASSPGHFRDVMANAIKVWSDAGRLKVNVKPEDVIDYEIVN